MFYTIEFWVTVLCVFLWGAAAGMWLLDRKHDSYRKTVDEAWAFMQKSREVAQEAGFREGYSLALHKTVTEGFVPHEMRMLGMMVDSGEQFPNPVSIMAYVNAHAQEIDEDFPKGPFCRKLIRAFYTSKQAETAQEA